MSDISNKLETLHAIWRTRDNNLVPDFERALSDVVRAKDPTSLESLLELFEDVPPSDDLMFSLVHAIEEFPDDVYVATLVAAAEGLSARSPRWSKILYVRILNNPSTRRELDVAVQRVGAQAKHAVHEILEAIKKKRPEFAERVDAITEKL